MNTDSALHKTPVYEILLNKKWFVNVSSWEESEGLENLLE